METAACRYVLSVLEEVAQDVNEKGRLREDGARILEMLTRGGHRQPHAVVAAVLGPAAALVHEMCVDLLHTDLAQQVTTDMGMGMDMNMDMDMTALQLQMRCSSDRAQSSHALSFSCVVASRSDALWRPRAVACVDAGAIVVALLAVIAAVEY